MSSKPKNKKVLTQEFKNFELIDVTPQTDNQDEIINSFEDNICTLIHGYPGTGKTFMSLFLMFDELMLKNSQYDKIVIIRSPVSTRDMGFLPGKHDEKMAEYEAPYEEIVNELFNRGDAYKTLKTKHIIEFRSSSFLRGITLKNCLVLVDEFQNMSWNEIHTIITRIGENCKVVVVGDTGQDDLTSERFKEESGAGRIMSVLRSMNSVGFVQMDADDIIRSEFVKEYILKLYP